jgi:hypothetical protein
MARYRIHRIKETPLENFRWALQIGGLAVAKPKDYELDREIEASSPYAAWKLLRAEGHSLRVGDILECVHPEGAAGRLVIAKYIGFEPAQWFVPEPPTAAAHLPSPPSPPFQPHSEPRS